LVFYICFLTFTYNIRPATAQSLDLEVAYEPTLDNSGAFSANSMSAVIGVALTGFETLSGLGKMQSAFSPTLLPEFSILKELMHQPKSQFLICWVTLLIITRCLPRAKFAYPKL